MYCSTLFFEEQTNIIDLKKNDEFLIDLYYPNELITKFFSKEIEELKLEMTKV